MQKFLQQITREAGKAILKQFGKIGTLYTKQDVNDIVTAADLDSNRIITDAIKKLYPTHGIISEETGESQTDAEYVWIIDPLDGTLNFATGIPLFTVMVGLAKNGTMEMAAVFNPCTDEFVFAEKGKGAFLNDEKVACSEKKEWIHSRGIVGSILFPGGIKVLEGILERSKKEICRIDAFGSFGISTIYLATGRRDWQALKRGLLWDCAAPALILQESGCKVTNFRGEPWSIREKEIAVANPFLHPTLIEIVKDI